MRVSPVEARGLVRSYLPLPVILGVHLQGADAKAVPAHHLDVDEAGEDRGLRAILTNLEIAEGERFVARRSGGDRFDVLLLVLLLAARVRVLQIVGQVPGEPGGILLDRGRSPTFGSFFDKRGTIGSRGNRGERKKQWGNFGH